MNNLEFTFEQPSWQRYLEQLAPGTGVNASQLLSLMEGEDESALEDALEYCQDNRLFPQIHDLPKVYGSGDGAVRLRMEEQLAARGIRPEALEPGDPLRIFLEEVAMTPAFGDEDLLAFQCAQGDENARDRLMNLNLARIIAIAGEHTGHGVLLMDLIQEGSLGLLHAIYNPGEGAFAENADWWIRFFMARAVILQAHADGVSQKLRQDLEDYRNVDEQLLMELGRNPTVGEIAQRMRITEVAALNLRDMLTIARKLNQAVTVPEPEEEAPEEQAVEDTAYFQTRQRVNEMLSGLTETEAGVISLRFGLEGGLPLSPEETGRKLGLTPDEVVAVETAAMTKMRNR